MVPDDDDDLRIALDEAWDDQTPATQAPSTQAPETKKEPHITTRLAKASRAATTTPAAAFRVESPSFVHASLTVRAPARTMTDEEELEDARRRSARLSDPPPKTLSEGSLNRAQLLSLADQAPPFDVPGGGALDLVEQQTPLTEPSHVPTDPVRELRDRFSLGDYSGALFVAEDLLEDDPEHAEALRYAENCRGVLAQMYTARIGPLDRVPFIAVPAEQLKWLSIDHRAGFVLSHVDGISSLEQILDVSGMPALDALRILYELAQQRVISFR